MHSDYEKPEREKLSWSEIDKRKEKGGQRKSRSGYGDGPYQSKAEKARVETKYKQKLEEMFSGVKKLPKEQKDQLSKLRDLTDRDAFGEGADRYLAEHGYPEAWEDLTDFLRHRSPAILSEVVDRLEKILAYQSDTRKGMFKKDLELIEMTTRDKDLRKKVVGILQKLP